MIDATSHDKFRPHSPLRALPQSYGIDVHVFFAGDAGIASDIYLEPSPHSCPTSIRSPVSAVAEISTYLCYCRLDPWLDKQQEELCLFENKAGGQWR